MNAPARPTAKRFRADKPLVFLLSSLPLLWLVLRAFGVSWSKLEMRFAPNFCRARFAMATFEIAMLCCHRLKLCAR